MDLLRTLRLALTAACTVTMAALLIRRRYPLKATVWSLCAGGAVIFLVNGLLLNMLGYHSYLPFIPFSGLVPMVILAVLLSDYRDGRLLFSILTAFAYGMIIVSAGAVAFILSGGSVAVDLAVRALCFAPLIILVRRYFRSVFFDILLIQHRGWYWMSLLPLSFYLSFYFLTSYPVSIMERPENLFALAALEVQLIMAYVFAYFLFTRFLRQQQLEAGVRVLETQIKAMEAQVEATAEAEERCRIHRHDTRHFTHSLTALLAAGDTAQALSMIGDFQALLEAAPPRQYCLNPTVNAVLSYYLGRAEQAGVAVDCRLNLPRELPVNALEVGTVVANAVENALHACACMPPQAPRRIRVAGAGGPQLLIEVGNTFAGQVLFDKSGLPATDVPGHGDGTRSIAAFAKRHRALLDYSAEAGWFRLRILIPTAGDS